MADPTTRIGDAERDEAVRQLQEHHAAGRLDVDEFDQRMDAALRARTQGDLVPLFRDLPATSGPGVGSTVAPSGGLPAPRTGSGTVEEQGTTWTWQRALASAAMPLAIVLCFATDWRYWWIMMVPMVINAFVWGGHDRDRHRDRNRGD